MTDFKDLVAVVTGGASGIGAATARLLQGRGARVAVLHPQYGWRTRWRARCALRHHRSGGGG